MNGSSWCNTKTYLLDKLPTQTMGGTNLLKEDIFQTFLLSMRVYLVKSDDKKIELVFSKINLFLNLNKAH